MMRHETVTVASTMPIKEFREKFPLGSKTQVIAVDAEGHYAGLAPVAEAHTPEAGEITHIESILHYKDVVLHPAMNIQQAIAVFDAAEAETLAVVEADDDKRPIGVLTEAHAMRRYAEESERRRREVVGDV
jgi:CIC family chloride channel protein